MGLEPGDGRSDTGHIETGGIERASDIEADQLAVGVNDRAPAKAGGAHHPRLETGDICLGFILFPEGDTGGFDGPG